MLRPQLIVKCVLLIYVFPLSRALTNDNFEGLDDHFNCGRTFLCVTRLQEENAHRMLLFS